MDQKLIEVVALVQHPIQKCRGEHCKNIWMRKVERCSDVEYEHAIGILSALSRDTSKIRR